MTDALEELKKSIDLEKKKDPLERFNSLVESGIIDEEGSLARDEELKKCAICGLSDDEYGLAKTIDRETITCYRCHCSNLAR